MATALFLLGLVFLGFVAGAAVMHFSFGPSDSLRKAFVGAQQWWETPAAQTPMGNLTEAKVTVDRADATFDGFTLITTTQSPEAFLLNMRGAVVHRWKMAAHPSSFPDKSPKAGGPLHWEKCYLYPNGDLLALLASEVDSAYGRSMVKVDKDSNLLWEYDGNVHHDVTVGEDGRIYVLTQKFDVPAPAGLDVLPDKYVADFVAILSPDGKELETIPLLEAFRESPYLLTVLSANSAGLPVPFLPPVMPPGGPPVPPPGVPVASPNVAPNPNKGKLSSDLLHANSIMVLSSVQAAKFPLFKAGQILISMRTPSVLAVLDPTSRAAQWATRGVWQEQHDAQFLPNGKLLLFDNAGSPLGSRILEYDPVTQATRSAYGGSKATAFTCSFRGGAQRLPNGNTLIVSANGPPSVFEVTASAEVVWRWCLPDVIVNEDKNIVLSITGARRHGPAELTFLKSDAGVRSN